MGILRARVGNEWVDVGFGDSRKPQGVIAHSMGYTATESADITANTLIFTLANVPFVAGRYYDIRSNISVICRAASGSCGALTWVVVGSFTVFQKENNMGSPNLMVCGDQSVVWQATATGPLGVSSYIGKTWWAGANNPKWIRGTGVPLGITVIDMGAA